MKRVFNYSSENKRDLVILLNRLISNDENVIRTYELVTKRKMKVVITKSSLILATHKMYVRFNNKTKTYDPDNQFVVRTDINMNKFIEQYQKVIDKLNNLFNNTGL